MKSRRRKPKTPSHQGRPTVSPHRSILFAISLLILVVATPAQSEEAWEAVAVKGMKTMNLGDGKAFAENAHTDFKGRMRSFMLDRMRATPTSEDTQRRLKEYGVSSLAELEKLPLDQFIQPTIHHMHASIPQPMRSALEGAQFKAVRSEIAGNIYRVTVEMTFTLNGKTGANQMTLLAKREGDTWKYYGDSK